MDSERKEKGTAMTNDMDTFAKISAKLYLNDKLQEFATSNPRAAWLWLNMITYAVDRKTDGFVSDFAAKRHLAAERDDLEALHGARLLDPADGGWRIHDFLESQVSTEEQDAIKAKRSAAGRKGMAKRWSGKSAEQKQTDNKSITGVITNAQQTDNKHITETETETETDSNSSNEELLFPARESDQPQPAEPWTESSKLNTEFEAVWNAYPRKEDPRRAQFAYRDARRRASFAVILAGAQKLAHDPNLDVKYAQKLAKWLDSDGWMNGPIPSHRDGPARTSNPARQRFDQNMAAVAEIARAEGVIPPNNTTRPQIGGTP